jgi:outer membrane lipoprotein carrier protein
MLPAAVLTLAMASTALAPQADVRRIIAAVAERHRQVADLEARFEQVYRSSALAQDVVESGLLQFKRPGRMRWEYRSPERKLFVSDGTHFYFYVPADRQVVVRASGGDQGMAFRLLTGDIDLAQEFDAGLDSTPGTATRLNLRPRRPDADVESVTLEVDASYRIQTMEILDLQGNRSTFHFREIKENRGLRDAAFRFTVPRGVEVMRE